MKQAGLGMIVCAAALAGCVGDAVEYGGVSSPVTVPGATVACDTVDLRSTAQPEPRYPPDLAMFIFATQRLKTANRMTFSYDIDAAGRAVNIKFVSPEAFLDHGALQKAIRAGADTLADWRFAWDDTPAPHYAAGCEQVFVFATDWERRS